MLLGKMRIRIIVGGRRSSGTSGGAGEVGEFIGLFVSLRLPRSRVGRLFASVEPGFVVGVVKGIQWAHERAVLGGGRSDTLSVVLAALRLCWSVAAR